MGLEDYDAEAREEIISSFPGNGRLPTVWSGFIEENHKSLQHTLDFSFALFSPQKDTSINVETNKTDNPKK
ncbi:hypothetical protein L596_009129 [Steinernema carpocapsae]|uniref:Uncharacterized protein n=1 Tax=Steinernema carpocapsae TaxID=34508 RepID=A0A4U5PEG4_STECR|nr:hypothetical protein L596_009129 [Steinernema carpocapsae]